MAQLILLLSEVSKRELQYIEGCCVPSANLDSTLMPTPGLDVSDWDAKAEDGYCENHNERREKEDSCRESHESWSVNEKLMLWVPLLNWKYLKKITITIYIQHKYKHRKCFTGWGMFQV